MYNFVILMRWLKQLLFDLIVKGAIKAILTAPRQRCLKALVIDRPSAFHLSHDMYGCVETVDNMLFS